VRKKQVVQFRCPQEAKTILTRISGSVVEGKLEHGGRGAECHHAFLCSTGSSWSGHQDIGSTAAIEWAKNKLAGSTTEDDISDVTGQRATEPCDYIKEDFLPAPFPNEI
jgi:hypothetical protein